MNAWRFLLLLLVGTLVAQTARAAEADDPRAANDFLTYHPDMANRKIGMDAYHRGNFAEAAEYFHRAARYADKASEAALAEMLWQGEGLAMDRAQAYAWMDLAAERGYPSLLAIRERYWQQLSPAEQARAVDIGQALYAEYGDSVAKPRLAAQLRRGLLSATGSHAGFVGNLAIHTPTPRDKNLASAVENAGTPGDLYYASRYWDEKEYFASQDAVWNKPQRRGVVDVGPLENVHDDKPAASGQPPSHND